MIDQPPSEAVRRREQEVAAREPEEVICSCCLHAGSYERAPIDQEDLAHRRDPQA